MKNSSVIDNDWLNDRCGAARDECLATIAATSLDGEWSVYLGSDSTLGLEFDADGSFKLKASSRFEARLQGT